MSDVSKITAKDRRRTKWLSLCGDRETVECLGLIGVGLPRRGCRRTLGIGGSARRSRRDRPTSWNLKIIGRNDKLIATEDTDEH